MAVAIMAVLAVVGFGFATSMKLEHSAVQAIRNLAQARMAARAAVRLLAGALGQDASAEPSGTGGPVADHLAEDLYTTGASQTLLNFGNLAVRSEQIGFRDEASKMNLNAFGNIAKWDYADLRFDGDGLPGTNTAADQLYHGANERFSSFEISFEEFFYQQRATLWPDVTEDENARIRAANLARAISLYRYGGKKDGDANNEPDYAGDGKPGVAGTDDDKDNNYASNGIDDDRDGSEGATDPDEAGFGLAYDRMDNDGDARNPNGTIDAAKVDEPNEGVDEPDEFNPIDPDGDGDTTTANGPRDDRKFESIEELVDAVRHSYSISGTDATGTSYSVTVPAAVNYSGEASPDQDALDSEAARILAIVKSNLTVYSFNLTVRSVSIDDPGHDGYDNDGDGKIDQADTTGQTTLAGIKAELDGGKAIHEVDINEKDINKAAQAAYIYWKLAREVKFYNTDGSTVTRQLVEGFQVQHAVDAVDYRDTDAVPTMIAAGSLGGGEPSSDTYGFEGLHVTEAGRYISNGDATAVASGDGPWTGTGAAGITVNISGTPADRTSVLELAGLQDGAYLLKLSVDAVPGTITFKDSDDNTIKVVSDPDTAVFVGPMNVSGGTGTISVTASSTNGTYTISDIHVLLPYIEIMNMSRRERDMTQFSVQIGTDPTATAITNITGPTAWANSEAPPPSGNYVARHAKLSTGFSSTHGVYYGFFIIAYDVASFTNNFGGGAVDCPVASMPSVFSNGFDGTQAVKILGGPARNEIVAGGVIDWMTAGTGETLSSTVLARGRTCPVNKRYADAGNPFSTETAPGTTTPSASPGRWNHNAGSNSDSPRYWPTAVTSYANDWVDAVRVADRGYYRSPAEITKLEVPGKFSTTFSLWVLSDAAWLTAQPDIAELPSWVVVGRAPARININTAPAAVMEAAFCVPSAPLPTADDLTQGRPYTFWAYRVATTNRSISSAFKDGTVDDDGENDGDDNSEQLQWIIRFSNVFTLKSNVFTATVSGQILNAGGDALAKRSYHVVCSRGRKLTAAGAPKVEMVSTTSAD